MWREPGPLRAWWLAFVVLAACGPWPGWAPPVWGVLVLAAAAVAVARPGGGALVAWAAAATAVLAAVVARPVPAPETGALADGLRRHCRSMLDLAEGLGRSTALDRLFAASGEVLDPSAPFELLDAAAGDVPGRTVYLSDDRGRLVAWGGESRHYPHTLRPLGERRWTVAWTATGGVLAVREPLIQQGRLVGAVTVADRGARTATSVWGMAPGRGWRIALGAAPSAVTVRAAGFPGAEVPLQVSPDPAGCPSGLRWLPWLAAVAAALWWRPWTAWPFLAVGGASLLVAAGCADAVAIAILVLATAAAVGRSATAAPRRWSRPMVLAGLAAAVAATLAFPGRPLGSWLPAHLLEPGWGGAWMVAVAWLVAGWPGLGRRAMLGLGRRMAVAAGLAAFAVLVEVAAIAVDLRRGGDERPPPPESITEVDVDSVLPAPAGEVWLADLAPLLARLWGLDRGTAPSELLVTDADGRQVSRWGDLAPAGGEVRLVTGGTLGAGLALELWTCEPPWNLLADWDSGEPRGAADEESVWYAVFDRAGTVAATLHPQVAALDPATAGTLFYAGGGWRRLEVGEVRRPAFVRREGDALVAAIARTPAPSVWVVQAAVAWVWALLGSLTAAPPVVRRKMATTFGGRLRLLVAGGIVLPLVILTLFLHLRLRREEQRLEQVTGMEGLLSARYATTHLAGGVPVDDELARWLARGWSGEVALFDGTDPVAVSRRDLMATGVLPELPAAAAYPAYLVGRDAAVVHDAGHRLVAAAPATLQGRRLLLQLYRSDPVRAQRGPGAVDWLLTGALLAALLTLVATSRIEQRLSASLRDLVGVARRLLDGQPPGAFRRPPETDLAEVLAAVTSMSEEVRERERVLRHQEELLRITLATLGPAVLVLDPSGRRRFANPSAERLEAEHGELLDRVIGNLTPSPDDAGGPVSETVRPVPGRELTWRIGVAPVPLPDGGAGRVAVVDDVTEVVRADRLSQLAQLARIVAHEVKNPLTPIRLWVQELEEARRRGADGLDELLEEACGEIGRQVERLQQTASSFSNLVALERWEPEPVDLGSLLDETVEGLGVLRRRGIELSVTVSAERPLVVVGDRQWLRRAVDNLVKNSLDALGEGGGEIRIDATTEDGAAVLQVEDTAGGVPDSQLKELFSPRFSTTTAGSGLGLALVHQVVVRCHGEVTATNGATGLVVRLRLPLRGGAPPASPG